MSELPTRETLERLLRVWNQEGDTEGRMFTLWELGQAMDLVDARRTEELLTRAEWEASIDYEAGQAASNGGLTSLGYIKLIVNAALHVEEDS